jgi:hypothetical protein
MSLSDSTSIQAASPPHSPAPGCGDGAGPVLSRLLNRVIHFVEAS